MHSRLLFTLILLCLSTLTSEIRAYGDNGTSQIPASAPVIYEIMLRDFTGTPGKALGDGTAAGMLQSVSALKNYGGTPLDYLSQLGIDAIQFTPTDACGTPDDYKTLINAAHERGIAVILDVSVSGSDCYDTLEHWISDYGADGFITAADNNICENIYKRLAQNYPSIYFINRNAATHNTDGIMCTTNLNDAACKYVSGQLEDASLDSFYSLSHGRTISYAESHDTDRVAYRAKIDGVSGVKGNDTTSATNRLRRLGSLAAQMLICPGPHTIWQFEELGADYISLNADGSPNLAPKTVLWNNINNSLYHGLHDTYSALCNIRRKYPGIFDGSAKCRTSLSSPTERYISLTSENIEMYLVVNPAVSGMTTICPINAVTGERVDLSATGFHLLTASSNVTPAVSSSGVSLPGGAFAVYAREHESAIVNIHSDSLQIPSLDIIDGVITPRERYDTITIRNISGAIMSPGSRLTAGLYLVTVDGYTVKVIVR